MCIMMIIIIEQLIHRFYTFHQLLCVHCHYLPLLHFFGSILSVHIFEDFLQFLDK
jgi:hypothetical protein